MKFLTLLLLLFCFNANATYCPDGTLIASHPNGDCNYKPPTPSASTQTQQQNQTTSANSVSASKSNSHSQSQADAQSKSKASSNVGDVGSTNSLSSIGNDNSQTSFKAFALSLPTPVFTAPLPSIADCPGANITQDAVAVGWNFFSKAHGEINTDNCSIMRIYNLMVESCRYETARQLLNKFTEKLMPGIEYTRVELIDLTPNECRLLKVPMPVEETVQIIHPKICERSDYAVTRNHGTTISKIGRKVQNKSIAKRCSA